MSNLSEALKELGFRATFEPVPFDAPPAPDSLAERLDDIEKTLGIESEAAE